MKEESAQGADTFKETALEWFEKHHSRWSSHYAIREKRNLEKDLFPYFAAKVDPRLGFGSSYPSQAVLMLSFTELLQDSSRLPKLRGFQRD